MGTETELKLTASPSMLRRTMLAPWLKKAALQQAATDQPKRQRITSIYFDTSDFALRQHGVSLRVRKSGSMHLQTIKAITNGVMSRDEWENEIEDDRPKLKLAKGTALAPLLTDEVRNELRPVFATAVERVVIPLRFNESEIELAFDQGRISTPDSHENISEIEIELKSGRTSDVAALARRLAKTASPSYGARAKPERGYALLDGTLQAAAPARSIAIEPDLASADAFVTIGFECLRHIASNEAAVRRGDPEGIHQMRVGLRRLRAALSLFKDMLHGQEIRALKADFEWLTEQLGPARDYEVLVSEAVSPLRERYRDRVGFGLLEKHFKHERDKGLTKAKAAVGSDRYRRTLLNTALWLLDGEWRMNHDALMVTLRDRPLADFAADEIKRRSRKIFKSVRKLDTMNSRRRHKLRISVKKVRYACEFLEAPLADRRGKKKLRRFDRALKALQSTLGQLNDMTVHNRLSAGFARATPATQKAFATGYLLGSESAHSEPLLRDAKRSGKDLRKAALFS